MPMPRARPKDPSYAPRDLKLLLVGDVGDILDRIGLDGPARVGDPGPRP